MLSRALQPCTPSSHGLFPVQATRQGQGPSLVVPVACSVPLSEWLIHKYLLSGTMILLFIFPDHVAQENHKLFLSGLSHLLPLPHFLCPPAPTPYQPCRHTQPPDGPRAQMATFPLSSHSWEFPTGPSRLHPENPFTGKPLPTSMN